MKKGIGLVLAFSLLIAPLAYADGVREASVITISHARTNYTNLGVTGFDTPGNPGYLVLTGAGYNNDGKATEWYMWVDNRNTLCMASYPTLRIYASFPDGNWERFTNAGACTRVGSQ